MDGRNYNVRHRETLIFIAALLTPISVSYTYTMWLKSESIYRYLFIQDVNVEGNNM